MPLTSSIPCLICDYFQRVLFEITSRRKGISRICCPKVYRGYEQIIICQWRHSWFNSTLDDKSTIIKKQWRNDLTAKHNERYIYNKKIYITSAFFKYKCKIWGRMLNTRLIKKCIIRCTKMNFRNIDIVVMV